MFFPDRIKSIRDNDKVLEIGPGATPYYRSDVFLELNYENKEDRIAQSGHVGILETEKTVVYYDGTKFPFKDNEFDYVVCSHVLEHVPNVDLFVQELTRVAKRGYLEFPNALYDYLYNIKEHLNFCYYNQKKIVWSKKEDFGLSEFKPLTDILHKTLIKEHFSFVNTFRHLFFQGFEWEKSLETVRTTELNKLVFLDETIDFYIQEALQPRKVEINTSLFKKIKLKLRNFVLRILKD